MANEVFANGLEVACKAADGVSSAAFPDVCFTPKEPVPFANTAYAKDMTNGSKTVFISGKMVGLKDHSYLKTSSGDNGARGRKGFSTGAKNGKAYFRSWSMNVKVEGYNVCRHTDSMTHNHGSQPPNTVIWTYMDTATSKKACKDTNKTIKEECKPKNSKKFLKRQEDKQKKAIAHNKMPRNRNNQKNVYTPREKTWKDDHCMKMLINPDIGSMKSRLQAFKDNAEEFKESFLDNMKQNVIDELPEKAFWTGAGSLVLHAGAVITSETGIGAVAFEAANASWTAYRLGDAASWTKEAYEKAKPFFEYLSSDKLDQMKNILDNLDNKEKIKEDLQKFRKNIIEEMEKEAKNDKCLQARKCMLVPFKKKEQSNKPSEYGTAGDLTSSKKNLTTKLGLGDTRGCCPGQTPHHMIPEAWFKGAECEGKNGEKTDTEIYNSSPTVCAEGNTHNIKDEEGNAFGSHSVLHENLDKIASEKVPQTGKFTITQAIDIATQAHTEAFNVDLNGWYPGGSCKDCIKAQLEEYFKKACKKSLNKQKTTSSKGLWDGSGDL